MSYVVDKPAPEEFGVVIGGGSWLLACAGVSVGPFAPGALAVDPDAGACLRLAATSPGAGAREIDAAAVTTRVVPLDEKDLEAIRAAALDEVARLAAERLSAPVDVGGVLVGLSEESRAKWVQLSHFVEVAPGVLTPYYPIPFPAQSGTGLLTSDAHVTQTYVALFLAGLQREGAATVATLAIRAATTTAEVVTALRAYQEAP